MRVLLVDDEVRIANFVARGLREASFAVDVSADGDEALYRLAIADYDAVILDIIRPTEGTGLGRTHRKQICQLPRICFGNQINRKIAHR